jgi:hypothetical protein
MSLVDLWAAGDIYGDSEGPGRQAPSKGEENIREVIKSRGVVALVEGIDDKVHWMLLRECGHLIQDLCQNTITRLLLAVVVGQMKMR